MSTSPKKRAGTAKTVRTSYVISNGSEAYLDQRAHADLQLDHRAQVNEIEHLKNTLVGLDEKLIVHNDLILEMKNHESMIKESEAQRAALQNEIVRLADKIREDTAAHVAYQDTLIAENN